MERWELAKSKGLNWQVVLIQDCETDIKIKTLESVRLRDAFNVTNKKVTLIIKKCIENLESNSLKDLVRNNMPVFASKIYLQWLNIYGNREQGLTGLLILNNKHGIVPESVRVKLTALPKASEYSFNNKEVDIAYNKATPNKTYSLNYEKEVISRVNRVLDQTSKEDYSARYSLRASAERQVRYEWQQAQLQKLYESGNDLVWIDTHANCSERCEAWQGKLYSISGKTGVVDGISYQPLSNATDRYETTKSGKTYINGTLTGFNCRHTTTPYKKGNKPTHIPADVIERQRGIESRQRELERTIRQYETRALGWKSQIQSALNKEEKDIALVSYRHNRNLVKKWQEEYIRFSKENNVAYYPSRIKI